MRVKISVFSGGLVLIAGLSKSYEGIREAVPQVEGYVLR